MGAPKWKTVSVTPPAEDPDLEGLLDQGDDPDLAGLLDAPAPANDNGGPKVNRLPLVEIEGDPHARRDPAVDAMMGGPPVVGAGEAFGRGAAQGAGFGFADEASGAGAAARAVEEQIGLGQASTDQLRGIGSALDRVGLDTMGLATLPDAVPYERAAARGVTDADRPSALVKRGALDQLADAARTARASYGDQRDNWRAEDDLAEEDRPGAFYAGMGTAALGTAALPLGGAVRPGMTLMQRAPLLAQAGGRAGAIAGAGASEAETLPGIAQDAATGAAVGAVAAPVLSETAGAVARPVLKWAGDKAVRAGKIANDLRLRSYGATKGDLDRLAKKSGGTARYAQGGERLGIGKGGMLPTPVGDIADEAASVQMAAQARKDAIADELANSSATVNPRQLARNIKGLKSEYAQGGSASQPLRDELDKIAAEELRMDRSYRLDTEIDPAKPLQRGAGGRFEKTPPIPLRVDVERHPPFSVMDKERRAWGNATNFSSDTPRQALRKDVYGQLNETMADAADQTIPGSGQAWRGANEDEHVALEIAEMAAKRARGEAANRLISPSDYGMGLGGAAGGFAMGVNPVIAGLAGVVGNKVIRGREHALGAGVMRGAQHALEQLGSKAASPNVAGPLPMGASRTAAQSDALQSLASRARQQMPPFTSEPAFAQDEVAPPQQPEQPDPAAPPQDLSATVRALLVNQPTALGPYVAEFERALQSDEESALPALMHKLSGDEVFTTKYLPLLQRQQGANP